MAFTGVFICNLWNSLESCWMWKHFSGKSSNYVLRNVRASLECIWCYQMSWIDRLWHSQNFTWARLLNVKSSQGKLLLTIPCSFQRLDCLWKSVGCYHMSREFLFDRPFLTGFLCSKFKFLWKIVGCKDMSSKLFDVNSCLEIDGWQEPQSGVVTSFQQGAAPPLWKRIC